MKVSRNFWWLIVLMSALFGARIVDTDLRGDSMNYAAISNNVLFSDNPLILYLNGELYMNKPPLFFWCNAFFIKLFGANPFSVKITTLLAVFLIAYFLYKIAMELFDNENTALILPLLYFTTYIVYKNTQMLKLEAFVSAFIIGTVFFFLKYLRTTSHIYALLMGLFTGLAIFSKGPIGLLPLMSAFFFPVIAREFASRRYYSHMLVALVISILIPSWWFIYISMNTPFFETFFISQIIDRIGNNHINLTETTYFRRPLWAYLLYILKYGGLFLILFPYGVYRLLKDYRITPGVKYMFLVGGIDFVLIHFITTREHRYLYQFYLFFWFAGAYGITTVWKKNTLPIIKFISIVLMLFILIYPKPLSWNSYKPLVQAAKISNSENLPVVAQPKYLNNISDKAAMSFYLRDYQTVRPEKGTWIEIVQNKYELEGAIELSRARRVAVYLVNANQQ